MDLGIVVPVRFTYSAKDESGRIPTRDTQFVVSPTFPNRMYAQVGVSLMLRLFQSID